jgi:hypothetical protein
MKKYKPEHLGKVMPSDPPKLKGFLQDNYEQFSEVYDACKDSSDKINDLKLTESTDSSISVKVSTTKEGLDEITEKVTAKGDEDLSISGDTVTSKKKKKDKKG